MFVFFASRGAAFIKHRARAAWFELICVGFFMESTFVKTREHRDESRGLEELLAAAV